MTTKSVRNRSEIYAVNSFLKRIEQEKFQKLKAQYESAELKFVSDNVSTVSDDSSTNSAKVNTKTAESKVVVQPQSIKYQRIKNTVGQNSTNNNDCDSDHNSSSLCRSDKVSRKVILTSLTRPNSQDVKANRLDHNKGVNISESRTVPVTVTKDHPINVNVAPKRNKSVKRVDTLRQQLPPIHRPSSFGGV